MRFYILSHSHIQLFIARTVVERNLDSDKIDAAEMQQRERNRDEEGYEEKEKASK